jgi:hypothetical protein
MALGLVALQAGCFFPCEATADCPDDQFCGESGWCTRQCANDDDCPASDFCTARGQCVLSGGALVEWKEPEEGAEVAGIFDVEVDVTIRSPTARVSLRRDPDHPGIVCAPFFENDTEVVGDPFSPVTQSVRFEGVRATGPDFGLQLAIFTDDGVETYAERAFKTQADAFADFQLDGEFSAPAEDAELEAGKNVSILASVDFSASATAISAWMEPLTGTGQGNWPWQVVSQGMPTAQDVRLPLVHGPQILWFQAHRQAGTLRCGRGLVTEEEEPWSGIEFAMGHHSPERGDLDLWVYHLDEDGTSTSCSVSDPGPGCTLHHKRIAPATWGEEVLRFSQREGTWGLAVAPAAVTDPVNAWVRISMDGSHRELIGPWTVSPQTGTVWLAGRVVVADGTLDVEHLERESIGLPGPDAASW